MNGEEDDGEDADAQQGVEGGAGFRAAMSVEQGCHVGCGVERVGGFENDVHFPTVGVEGGHMIGFGRALLRIRRSEPRLPWQNRTLTQRIPKPAPDRPGPCFGRSRVSRFQRMDSIAVRFGTNAEERRKTQPIQPRLYQALSIHSGQVEADPKAFRPFAKADVAAVAAQDGTGDRKA